MTSSRNIDAAHAQSMLPPYGLALGLTVEAMENDIPLLALDFSERLHGRPGYLHGGAISGLLEMAAIVALRCELERRGAPSRIKPINMNVEFLRGGTQQRTFALGRVTRAGRRVANVSAEAWQDDRGKPIATAWLNVLLGSPDRG